jgi:glycosyltransferase involved in cell wall biosynthesis
MKVSIIIPAFNAQKTIREAINSAINQDFLRKNFEIIVVNDGSIDNTLNILKEYEGEIKVINQENQGAVKAANKGFKEAKGDCVVKLDADDCFLPNLLSKMVYVLNDKNINFVYSDYYEKKESGEVKIITTENIFNTVSIGIMFRREDISKEGFYREDIRFPEYDLLLKVKDKWNGCRIAKPLFFYNRTRESLTGNKEWLDVAIKEIREIHFDKIEEIKKIRDY